MGRLALALAAAALAVVAGGTGPGSDGAEAACGSGFGGDDKAEASPGRLLMQINTARLQGLAPRGRLHAAAPGPRARGGGAVDMDGFDRVLDVCQMAGGNSSGGPQDMQQDSVLLSGLFLLKQVFPAAFAQRPHLARLALRKLQSYSDVLASAGDRCGTLASMDAMARLDLWFFPTMDPQFGAQLKQPSPGYVQCLNDQLPGGASFKQPRDAEGYLKLFINGMELENIDARAVMVQSGDRTQPSKGMDATFLTAERYFTGSRCKPSPSNPDAEPCAYYYTHRLLGLTHLMTRAVPAQRRPELEDYTSRLLAFMGPYVEGHIDGGRVFSEQAVDLVGEAAFVLKAVSCRPDSDPVVAKLNGVLQSSPLPQSFCHGRLTMFMGGTPAKAIQRLCE